MTTKTMTDVDQKNSITSDANCNVSFVNGRREAIHAPTGPSSLVINKNIVEALRGRNTSIQAKSCGGQISTIVRNTKRRSTNGNILHSCFVSCIVIGKCIQTLFMFEMKRSI